ncbi:class I glutamine amidotransferase-like protein, partial [Pholiota conissans]
FTLDPFFVQRDQLVDNYPDPEQYDALVLTGSAANAYDDIPWINALVAYIKRVAEQYPRVRIVGICFGHQIVARALGGACVPNAGRWEIGPTRIELTDLGKKIFGADKDDMTIQQMHRDHVPSLPPSFHLLGSTALSPVQGMVRFLPPNTTTSSTSSPPPSTTGSTTTPTPNTDPSSLLRSIQILTVQGHPEFTEPVVSAIVSQRAAAGAIDAATEGGYVQRRWEKDDGRGRIARAVWGVV